jgi:hypothetical protein
VRGRSRKPHFSPQFQFLCFFFLSF